MGTSESKAELSEMNEETKQVIIRNITAAFPNNADPELVRLVLDRENWDLDKSLATLKRFIQTSSKKPKKSGGQPGQPRTRNKGKSDKPAGPAAAAKNKPPAAKEPPATKEPSSAHKNRSQGPQNAAIKVSKREGLVRTYNDAINTKNQTQRITSLVVSGIKTMVIMRGCPGSGKTHVASTLSAHLAREVAKAKGDSVPTTSLDHHLFEADNFWLHPKTGKYLFNAEYIEYSHLWVQKLVRQACAEGRSPLFIGNTHSRLWEMKVVVSLAVEFGYTIEIIDPTTKWAFDVKELTRRNVHGVHAEPIQRMIDRYEHGIKPAQVMAKYNLSYAFNAQPPQKCLVTFDTLPSRTQTKLFNSRFHEVPLEAILALKEGAAPSSSTAQAPESAYKVKSQTSGLGASQQNIQPLFSGPSRKEIPNDPDLVKKPSDIAGQQQHSYLDMLKAMKNANAKDKPNANLFKHIKQGGVNTDIKKKSKKGGSVEPGPKAPGPVEMHQSEPTMDDFQLISFDRDDDEAAKSSGVDPAEATGQTSTVQSWEEKFKAWLDSGLQQDGGGYSSSNSSSPPSEVGSSCTERSYSLSDQDTSTNTHYADFQALNRVNAGGFEPTMRTLQVGRFVSGTAPIAWDQIKTVATHDKSTTTASPTSTSVSRDSGLEILRKMFPTVSHECLTELFDKCEKDLDWTVNLVLDSGLEIADSFVADPVAETTAEEPALPEKAPTSPKPLTTQKLKKPKGQLSDSYSDLLKEFESSFVLSADSYSDQLKKVRETKLGLKPLEIPPSPEDENPLSSTDESDGNDEEMSLILPKTVVSQLQDKFCPMPNTFGDELIVKLPVELARQIYSYALDSIYQEMEQQNLIEFNVKEDEILARKLQEEMEESDSPASLQQIMNYEMLLRKREKEAGKAASEVDSFASKLSHQLLSRRFPKIDSETLKIVLSDTNQSLHQATNLLSCAGHEPVLSFDEETPAASIQEESVYRMSRQECIQQANAYHDVSAKLNEMKKHYHAKSRESFNSGNYAVAMFYRELCDWYTGRIEESNSKAAQVMLIGNEGAQTVDLHFLTVSEAVKILDLFLDETIRRLSVRKLEVYIITGRGLHSSDGKSKIKPAVKDRLRQRGLSYSEVNPGMLKIAITKSCLVSYQLVKE